MCVCFAGDSCKRDDQESGHWWGDPFDPGRRETTNWNQPAHTAHHEENQGVYLVRPTNCSLDSKTQIHKFSDLAQWKHGRIFETPWCLRCPTVSYNPQSITEFWNSSELILRFMCNIKDNFLFMTLCLCWCGGAGPQAAESNPISNPILYTLICPYFISQNETYRLFFSLEGRRHVIPSPFPLSSDLKPLEHKWNILARSAS